MSPFNTRTYETASEFYAHSYFSAAMTFGSVSLMTIEEKIRYILKATGWTQARLAEELKTSQPTVNRWLKGAEPEGHRRDAINDLYESVSGSIAPDDQVVPLVGRVGAGQAVHAVADNDPDQFVEAPMHATPTTVGVEVDGNSMFPAFEDGSILYYSKLLPPEELVNRRAVVQLGDGRIFVKVIRRGSTPDTWTLQSVNTEYADMVDEVVAWAAPIDWIKPRRF